MSSTLKGSVYFLPLLFFLLSASLVSQNRQVIASSSSSSSDQGPSYRRLDPLRSFKYYNGVYDVRNEHYWASTAFTGVHGYAIAGVWLLCGIGFGVFMILKHQSISSWPIKDFLDHHYLLMFLMVIFFTFLAIVTSSVVLLANQSSVRRMDKLKGTLFSVGGDARRSIRKVVNAMTQMQYLLVPYDPSMAVTLNTTTRRLGSESRAVQCFIEKNGHSIDRAIQTSTKINHLPGTRWWHLKEIKQLHFKEKLLDEAIWSYIGDANTMWDAMASCIRKVAKEDIIPNNLAIKRQHISKMSVAKMLMLRWISGYTRMDRIRNEIICSKVGVAPIEDKVHEGRLRWYVVHVLVVTTNLVLIIGALVLILLHWYPGFVFFAEDTCSAFEEFEVNPQNSSLSTMLPCMDPSSSDKMMVEIGFIVYNFITQLNSKIPDYHRLLQLEGGQLNGDQYLSGFVNVCNPFDGAPNYSYVPESCPKNAIPIGHLPHKNKIHPQILTRLQRFRFSNTSFKYPKLSQKTSELSFILSPKNSV
ncbi:hypothetical protein L484_009385 [Morus notabilis]|uniref:Uncharacterized protein n=1 Tax=Morus notabilis TaxID=981085 RepID=W9RS63_9ROSA|nr:hypothetical protein L484_009385 [Morus notabilis]